MRLLPIFFAASFAARFNWDDNMIPEFQDLFEGFLKEDTGKGTETGKGTSRGHFGDEIAVQRRADEKRYWSMRSALGKYFKSMHKKFSNAYINELLKKYEAKQMMKMIKARNNRIKAFGGAVHGEE